MSKRVTSFDVAKKAGVSRSIVSAVINGTKGIGVSEEKRRLVLQAIKELNYQVDANARGMRTGRSYCIAAYDNFGSKFFLQILQGLKNVCAQEGYFILLHASGGEKKSRDELIDLYLQRRIDGIITKDSTSFVDQEWAREIRNAGIPYISVEGYPENNQVASVLTDYAEGIEMALNYLQDKELPVPIYVELYTGPAYKPNWGDRQRRNSYNNWMSIRGYDPRIVTRQDDSWSISRGWWIDWLQTQTLPITILANWSRGATNIYKAAHQLGLRIGKDLFVMAADNTEQVNEHLIPSLSAVEVPYTEMGEVAARRLLEYIEGSRDLSDTSSVVIPSKLIQRESTVYDA